MVKRVRWGALSAARIAVNKVLPAMQQSELCSAVAIASRDLRRAKEAAALLGIATAYASYEELLADPNVDAIYNPLPNHLHVPWTIKAAEAGKHVLCEKPIGMNAAEAQTLVAVRERTGVRIGEALMVRSHPQWLRLRELLAEGRIGELRSVLGYFSYFNTDPTNIRNRVDFGGGALLDLGCYLVQASRYAFDAEPVRAVACINRDPQMGTDRLTSAMLEFPRGQAVFTCSTQMVYGQRLHFIGTRGRIEMETPVSAPFERPTRLFIDTGKDLFGGGVTTETFPICNQYTLQCDAFSRAVLEGTEVPVPLEDAIKNMAVIDALFRSSDSGKWESPQES
jgi:predicted dehydrogenase